MTVLVVAAHPDDEVLGCGATMAKHVRAGDAVHVFILGEGGSSRSNERDDAVEGEVDALATAAHEAGRILGVSSVRLAGLPDNLLDTVAELTIVKAIETEIGRVNPEIVYTHHAGDLNVDHAIVARCVQVACRPVGACPVRRVLAYESVSSTEWSPVNAFVPNWFVDVEETMDVKLAALRCYDVEMRAPPHPRSYEAIDSLARWRGASAGFVAAEAFALVRSRED